MPVYKKNNKWYFRTYYTDIMGNRKQKNSKLYSSKTLAKDAEIEFLNKNSISNEIDKNVSFESVYNEWLKYKKRLVKPSTFYSIDNISHKYIFSFFKEYKLFSIKINTINIWYELLEKYNITIESKNRIIGFLKDLFIYARDNYDFDTKIVSKIQKIRNDKPDYNNNSSKWNFWTYDEYKIFISYVDNDFYYLIFNFLYYTGVRKGEMFALTWNDIDFVNKKIKINKSCCNKLGIGTYQILKPKTQNSIREIDIDNKLIELLEKHYLEESKIIEFNKNMFVFGNLTPLSGTTLARNLDYYIKKAKVKKITPHGFRHSHVSLLIALGCDSRDVAERIGDTVDIVEKTYSHMFPDKKSITVKLLNNLKENISY